MAIRVSHGKVSDVGQLAQEAGRAEASQVEANRNQQITLQAMQNSARLQSQQMQINAQKEMADFQNFVNTEAEKRRYAFQVEREEMARVHDAEMIESRKQMLFDIENEKFLRANQEREANLNRLDTLRAEGKLSEEEYNKAYTEVETGYRIKSESNPISAAMQNILNKEQGMQLGASKQSTDPVNELMLINASEETGRKVDYLREFSQQLNPIDQQRLQNIIATGKESSINQAFEEVKKNLQGSIQNLRNSNKKSEYTGFGMFQIKR